MVTVEDTFLAYYTSAYKGTMERIVKNLNTKEWPLTDIGTVSPSIDLPEAAVLSHRSTEMLYLLHIAVLQGNLMKSFGRESFF